MYVVHCAHGDMTPARSQQHAMGFLFCSVWSSWAPVSYPETTFMEPLGLKVSLALSPCAHSHLLSTAVLIPLPYRESTPQRSPVAHAVFSVWQRVSPFSEVCPVLMCQRPNANLASTIYPTVQDPIPGYINPDVCAEFIFCALPFFFFVGSALSFVTPTCATRCSKNAALGFQCVLFLVMTTYSTPPPAHVALSFESPSCHLSQGCFCFALLASSRLRMAGL